MFLSVRFCCSPLKRTGLCSSRQLNYMWTNLIYMGLCLWGRRAFILKLMVWLQRCNPSEVYLEQSMYSIRSFFSGDRKLKWFLFLHELWELFCLQLLNNFSLSFSVPSLMEFHHTHVQNSKGLLYRLLEIFLYITPSFLVHCPVNSSHHGFPLLRSVSDTTQQYHRVLFGFPLPATWSGNCIGAESQSNHRVHLFCFPSFRNQCCVAHCPIYEDSCSKCLVQFSSCL